jgi:hypothetical protein
MYPRETIERSIKPAVEVPRRVLTSKRICCLLTALPSPNLDVRTARRRRHVARNEVRSGAVTRFFKHSAATAQAMIVAQNNRASAARALRVVKLLHTFVWAFFAISILSIPVLAWWQEYWYASALIAVVLVEVLVLLVNGLRCPLTGVAARFTEDRRDNFDIYLPVWLARHNKLILGTLYVVGTAFTAARWIR